MTEDIKQQEEKIGDLVPPMNVNLPAAPTQQNTELSNLIPDENLVGMFGEIIDDLRSNEKELDGLINNFSEMVMNEGDSTSASKEALVNLIKIKTDLADKKTKVADLMTRIKLQERNTFPKYLATHVTQNNNIKVDKRELIKSAEKEKLG